MIGEAGSGQGGAECGQSEADSGQGERKTESLTGGAGSGQGGAESVDWKMSTAMSPRENNNRRLLRARDAMDRDFAARLDIAALARIALISPAHFIREFGRAFGESPHRYLQRRRIERAMTLLRTTSTPVTEIAFAVGFSSLGTFSRTFADIVGRSPSRFRLSSAPLPVPGCFAMAWTRPSSAVAPGPGPSIFGEAAVGAAP